MSDEVRKQYQDFVDGLNRATDREIDEAMANILRCQRERNVLRPSPRKFTLSHANTQGRVEE